MTDRQEMEALADCPFCGGKAYAGPTLEDDYRFSVDCTCCGSTAMDRPTLKEAIELWNTRTPRPAADREELARIIEPRAFELREMGSRYAHDRCEDALEKADRIMERLIAPSVTTPAGEAEPEYLCDDDLFNKGVQHVVEMLAYELGVADWIAGDGSEDYDTDLSQTLYNILAAKGLYNKDEGEFAKLPAPGGAEEPIAWRWRFVDEKGWVPCNRRPKHANDHDVLCEPLYAHPAPGDGAIREALNDARRYQRLRVLGCAPSYTTHLQNGMVLRFTNLDEFVDSDLKSNPSRGEAASVYAALPPQPPAEKEG